jgi:hypothetical protein
MRSNLHPGRTIERLIEYATRSLILERLDETMFSHYGVDPILILFSAFKLGTEIEYSLELELRSRSVEHLDLDLKKSVVLLMEIPSRGD